MDPAQVAKWAGHSLEVLRQVYAKSLHGRENAARDVTTYSPRTPVDGPTWPDAAGQDKIKP
ncbi:hypothetical protein [Alloactinosynnema sp. L-07]|nr:hypothetical protein [Alloactinosynnema sp. L-07]